MIRSLIRTKYQFLLCICKRSNGKAQNYLQFLWRQILFAVIPGKCIILMVVWR